MRIGEEIEVEIERIVPGGWGLAHAHGATIMVALAAPKDRARVRIERVSSRVQFASIARLIEPSPARVAPRCPFFGRCGGCDFQQLDYNAQLAAKVEIVRDCLRRIARLESDPLSVVPSPAQWGYRSRAEWQLNREFGRIGYFMRGSHEVVEIKECPVLAPPLMKALVALGERDRFGRLPPSVRSVHALAGDDGSISLAPSSVGELVPEWGAQPRAVQRTVNGMTYRLDAECFFQVNEHVLTPLIRAATDGAGGDLALDLYSGVGLFTLPLAKRAARVVAVEENPSACRFARVNAQRADAVNIEVRCASVLDWLRAAEIAGPVDFVLLDPPRAGLENETVARVLQLAPARISYVGCDPAAMARDVRKIVEQGYALQAISLFDMFPQTHHIETVVQLVRKRR
ncbi:MAG: hypothetical protein C4334_02610 [Pyrinomonas sp.]|uniref:class I SAM-dependent RNA methyltransferase n=1 Tax=Pyrinomonas sp. TaxID=2080306 RepID=UPI0033247F31